MRDSRNSENEKPRVGDALEAGELEATSDSHGAVMGANPSEVAANDATIAQSFFDTAAPEVGQVGFETEVGTQLVKRPSGDAVAAGSVHRRQSQLPDAFPEIEGYTLIEVLGRGGMGIVYRAVQQNANREVALKVILGGSADEIVRHRRFQLEAQAAARISHPNVVTIYEVNFKDATPFFSMQLVRGTSLLGASKEPGFNAKRAAQYVAQAARGLHAAHELGILHRDLKPENILVDTANNQAYVTDFGLAKPQDVDHSLTQAGDVFGTPAYMSPEQIRDITRIDARSDIYSLGATLYRLLAGRNPFEGNSAMQLFDRIQNSDPEPLGSLNATVPKDLETICLKCIEKSPDLRYPSAGALARDLEAFVAGEPIAARPVSRLRKCGRWIQNHPAAVTALACGLLLVLVAGITVPLVVSGRKEANRQQAIRERIMRLDDAIASLQLDQLPAMSLLAEMETLRDQDKAAYSRMRNKLSQTENRLISEKLSAPRFTESDYIAMESLIQSLREDEKQAQLLTKLEQRRTSWNEVLNFSSPYEDVADMTLTSAGKTIATVEKSESGLTLVPEDMTDVKSYRIFLPETSDLHEQLSVEFTPQWREASLIGLFSDGAVSTNGSFNGWEVRLTLAPTSSKQPPKTFAEAIAADSNLQLQFLQAGRIVLRQALPATDVSDPTLRLRLTRDGELMRCQVNRSPEVVFDQGFTLETRGLGKPGVLWPGGTSITSLLLQQTVASQGSQPLDEADAAFRGQRYEESLDMYSKLRLNSTESEFRDECQFKMGLCFVQTKRPNDAIREFGSLLGQSVSAWATRAGVELLWMQLKANNFDEAVATLTQLGSRFSPETISKRVSYDRRNNIFVELEEAYPKTWVRDATQLSRVQLAIDGFDVLDGSSTQKVFAQIKFLETQALMGDIEAAFRGARKMVETDFIGNPEMEDWDVFDGLNCYTLLAIQLDNRDNALQLIDQALAQYEPRNFKDTEELWVLKAKLLADGGANEDALVALEKYWSLMPEKTQGLYLDSLHFAGWIYHDQGDIEAAMATWKEGFEIGRDAELGGDLSVATMGSLSNVITPKDAEQMLLSVSDSHEGELAINFFRQFVPMHLIHDGARFMWQTELGKEAARRIATDNAPFREQVTSQLSVAAFYFFKQMTLEDPRNFEISPGKMDPAIRKLSESLLAGYEEGRLGQGDFIPIGIAYLGQGFMLGWGSIESSAKHTMEEKVAMAYCLARHMKHKNRPKETEKLLRFVVENGTDELLTTAANDELDKRPETP